MGPENLGDPYLSEDEEDLNNRVNRLPPEVQELIAAYSSFFLEPDVRGKFLKDPQNLNNFSDFLQKNGFDSEAVDLTFRVLKFPRITRDTPNIGE